MQRIEFTMPTQQEVVAIEIEARRMRADMLRRAGAGLGRGIARLAGRLAALVAAPARAEPRQRAQRA